MSPTAKGKHLQLTTIQILGLAVPEKIFQRIRSKALEIHKMKVIAVER